MDDPVPIPAHLVDPLDEAGILSLVDAQEAEDTALLDVLDRFVDDPYPFTSRG
jgi:hypothetical protein